jgi:addiction module HigA family antidote
MADMLSPDNTGPQEVEIVDDHCGHTIAPKKLVIVASLPPLHPGEVLREEFLKPMGLTPYAVARPCGALRTRIERIAREELGISADTALRLGLLLRNRARVLAQSPNPS